MNIQQMRENVKARYPSARWAQKVQKMSDEQVVAIHIRLQLSDKPKNK